MPFYEETSLIHRSGQQKPFQAYVCLPFLRAIWSKKPTFFSLLNLCFSRNESIHNSLPHTTESFGLVWYMEDLWLLSFSISAKKYRKNTAMHHFSILLQWGMYTLPYLGANIDKLNLFIFCSRIFFIKWLSKKHVCTIWEGIVWVLGENLRVKFLLISSQLHNKHMTIHNELWSH